MTFETYGEKRWFEKILKYTYTHNGATWYLLCLEIADYSHAF